MKMFFSAGLAFFVLLATNSFSQKPIELKFNLPKGSGYDYSMDMNSTTKVSAGGQDVTVGSNMGVGYHFQVIDDSAGWKRISSTISRIALSINTMGVNVNFDSDKPVDTSDITSAMLGKVLGSMKGSTFEFTMNQNGEIGYVTGINDMLSKIMASSPDASGAMAGNLAQAFNEQNFKQNLKQVFGMYPGKPVKPGDSWTTTSSSFSNGAQMDIENTYTLQSVENNLAIVNVSSKISSPADTSANVSISGGTMTGIMKFDVPTGIPIDGDLSMLMDMTVNQGGQTMPVSTEIRMKVTGRKS